MNDRRLAAAAAGVGVALLAVVGTLTGVLDGAVTLLVAALGNDYVVVASLGVLAVAGALALQARRGRTGVEQVATPDAEDVYGVPRPGSSFESFLAPAFAHGVDGATAERVRDDLRELAVAVEMREGDRGRAAARERVADGTWTRDRVAAAFLRRGGRADVRTRVRAALRGRTAAQWGARRAAVELDDRASEALT